MDLTVMQDGEFVSEDQEDLFFVDTRVCPQENQNMAQNPEYQVLIAQIRSELWAHCKMGLQ